MVSNLLVNLVWLNVLFRCDLCGKEFPTAEALLSHGQKIHGRYQTGGGSKGRR